MAPAKLGKHLEWHGRRIRVVVRVPPSLVTSVGKTKLKVVLETTDPLEAEREKVDVIKSLRASLRGEQRQPQARSLTTEALEWRDMIEREAAGEQVVISADEELDLRDILGDHVDDIERKHGYNAGNEFAEIALGRATPLGALLDRWFTEKADLSIGYKEDIRRAVSRLETWCGKNRVPKTVEAITRRVAGRFIHEQYVLPREHHKTANKDLSCLRSYWRWMRKRYDITDNPWSEQSVEAPRRRTETASDKKRPFTDDEVTKLLGGIRLKRERDFSLVSSLSGLRLEEVAGLKVADCADDALKVRDSKTESGLRTVPLHPSLKPLITERTRAKAPDDYLFDDLGEQREGSKRDRSAPVSQAFTRERRRLKVDERGSADQRQSNIDFHSWRRWFIRKAVEGIERGAVGYTPWTIANVVGHKVEGGAIDGVALPLKMTMGRYPGPASVESMRACVEAVALPNGVSTARTDTKRQPRRAKLKLRRDTTNPSTS
ncbi:tyrosine-type recombinase/integrase [Chelatococcus asaccharovorans]|uniref:Tyr recombinase domain-containing protein n=1 Tax=Chelatococcus asaccharovorans TaxID=28210 RepID=A0A2V3U7G2_9HYPH|nr:hypothetical protein [Chelatococcus asaccharovorans]MBS7705187.1 hypothetical protein [Chelatococcus asaccharovorans]PXW53684.1 hypothetical protein C7450_113172 [Chelatococcus asaccharovorans]